MGTVQTLISDALKEISALGQNEEMDAEQVVDGQKMLKSLVDQWSISGLMVPFFTIETFALSNVLSSYTWKSGGAFNSASPVEVIACSFLIGSTQTPLDRMDVRMWSALPITAVSGAPTMFMFDRQLAFPTLYLDCIPYGGSLKTVSKKAFNSTFVLTDATTVTFPPEYERLLRTHLAIDMSPSYEKPVSAELAFNAKDAMKIVRRHNAKPAPTMRTDVPNQGPWRATLPFTSS